MQRQLSSYDYLLLNAFQHEINNNAHLQDDIRVWLVTRCDQIKQGNTYGEPANDV